MTNTKTIAMSTTFAEAIECLTAHIRTHSQIPLTASSIQILTRDENSVEKKVTCDIWPTNEQNAAFDEYTRSHKLPLGYGNDKSLHAIATTLRNNIKIQKS